MTRGEPFNLEAERAVLGAILLEPDCTEKAASVVEPGDFSKAHSLIFSRCLDLFQAGRIVDPHIVKDELQSRGELEAAGGPVYILGLTDAMPRGANVSAYAERIRKAANARKARAAIEAAYAKAADIDVDPKFRGHRTYLPSGSR